MYVALTEAEKKFAELVRLAQGGEEIVLTQADGPDLKLVLAEKLSTSQDRTSEQRLAAMKAIRDEARSVPDDGISAARSQDFLYGDDGMPK